MSISPDAESLWTDKCGPVEGPPQGQASQALTPVGAAPPGPRLLGLRKTLVKANTLFQIKTSLDGINRMAAEILSPDAESFWAN